MISIRPATRADDDAIWRVLEPTLRAGETYPQPRDISRADALAYWWKPEHSIFVAVDEDDRVVGTYYIKPNSTGPAAHVANCGYMALPEASGRGVGRALCLHSLEEGRRQGYRAIQFNLVIATNARALHLWQACGFEIVGRLPGAFEHPTQGFVDAFVMYQEL
ncbi:MAG: GNAT family N-acetyltransferase [Proteobacteria bacterium]|nr:GNAT family N-acetyltransferase [Pseudomonadota bacterium]